MNISILLNTLLVYLNEYFPQELDPSYKPKDSSGCTECRSTKYDFIIVGAGAAGCVLANRLSENPNWNVLLIEAGGDEDYITDIPALGGLFTGTKYDWNYTTVKQDAICQDNNGYCKFPLGYVMGGSSTIGDMVYMRGRQEDYNKWAESGNPGWSYKDVLPYFLKSEKIEIPALEHSSYHSAKGLLPVSESHIKSHILDSYLKLSSEYGIKENNDYNSGFSGGMSFEQATIEGGTRSSSSKSFLNPIRDRKNLNIFKNTLVTKVLFSNDAKKKAIGVSCITDGQQYDVTTSKEVILSAGAVNTPKLLMLSGIGPKKHLEELGIPVFADLPVGENLIDLPGSITYFRTNAKELIYDDTSLNEAMLNYAKNRNGILSSPQKTFLVRLNFNLTAINMKIEPNIMVLNGYSLPDLSFNGGSKYPSLAHHLIYLTPSSRGMVKLKSNNYQDAPLIDPKYLSENSDFNIIKNLIAFLIKYNIAKPRFDFSNELVAPSECTFNGNITEEFLSCYVRNINYVGMYPMSTAKMGPASDKTAVVDSNLKVHGIDNLRVVDASVIPQPVRALPYATVDMIAEKASKIIQSNYE